MPLIDLKSNLNNLQFTPNRVNNRGIIQPNDGSSQIVKQHTSYKTLKYQGDMPGYGISGQPFIQLPISGEGNSQTVKNLYIAARTSIDFPIRGGGIDYNSQSDTFTVFSAIDKQRIKAFLESKPRGAAFIQKQIGLQLSNPNVQTGTTFSGVAAGLPIPGVLQNTKVYNKGRNTLAQVGFSGTGLHATRIGNIPIDIKAQYYAATVGAERNLSSDQAQVKNRLLILNNLKMTDGSTFTPLSATTSINEINALGISRNKNLLFDYLTGPGSVYGIGKTTIRRYEDTRQAGKDWSNSSQVEGFKSPVLTYDDIIKKNRSLPDPNSKINLEETREKIYRLNVGSKNGSDQINLTAWKEMKNEDPWPNADPDLIKLGFECISNNDPSNATFLQFRALLNSGINDNNNASLNAFKYMGRGEEFFTYQGFQRTITFGFIVYASSEEEMRPIYNKLNYLVSQTYPDYSPITGLMRAPLVRVTIGDYLYRQPGFLENVSLNIDQTYSWEIGDGLQLPQAVGVTINFKPIFDEIPRRATLDTVINNTGKYITTNYQNIPKILANREGIIEEPEANRVLDPEILAPIKNEKYSKTYSIAGPVFDGNLPRPNFNNINPNAKPKAKVKKKK